MCVWVQYIVAKALCYKLPLCVHCGQSVVLSEPGWHLLHGNNTLLLTISMATTYCCQHSNNTLGITHIHHHYHPHTSSLAPTPIHTHSSTDTNRHPAGTPKPQNHWGHTVRWLWWPTTHKYQHHHIQPCHHFQPFQPKHPQHPSWPKLRRSSPPGL